MGAFEWYLLIINIVGFLLFVINLFFDDNEVLNRSITVTALIGGSVGVLLGILAFARKPEKYNMMSRVFLACVLVVQLVLLLIIKGHIAESVTLKFWEFFGDNKFVFYYLIAINIVTFAVFAVDKIAAIENRSRIRIITLLGLAFVGGSIGALVAMYLLRHKTQKDYFTVGVPLIIVMQVVVIFYAMNAAW